MNILSKGITIVPFCIIAGCTSLRPTDTYQREQRLLQSKDAAYVPQPETQLPTGSMRLYCSLALRDKAPSYKQTTGF